MIRAVALFLFASILTLADDAPAAKNDVHQQVDKIFAKWDSTVSPGCALSVIKDGQIVYKRGYGMADLDHDIPITPETVFHVASISKQFTAAAIILLAQEGKISLDDDVRKYIPELPDFGARHHHSPTDPSHQRPSRPMVAARPGRLALFARPDHRRRCARRHLASKGTELHAGSRVCVLQHRLHIAGANRQARQRRIAARVYVEANLPAAWHEEHALSRRSRRDRQAHRVRLCGMEKGETAIA